MLRRAIVADILLLASFTLTYLAYTLDPVGGRIRSLGDFVMLVTIFALPVSAALFGSLLGPSRWRNAAFVSLLLSLVFGYLMVRWVLWLRVDVLQDWGNAESSMFTGFGMLYFACGGLFIAPACGAWLATRTPRRELLQSSAPL